MREILFRGKRTDNGEWVSGGSIVQFVDDGVRSFYMPQYNEKCTSIHDSLTDDILGFEDCRFYKVDGETICQFTGLKDKNGKPIFEGDMLRMDDDEDDVGVIIFKDGCFRLEIHGLCGTWTESGFDEYGGGYGIIECEPIDYWYLNDMEIIGNIHDNPELMKREEK